MMRFFLLAAGLQLLLIQGCQKKQQDEMSTLNQASVYLKGTPLQLSTDELSSIIKQTDNALSEGQFEVTNRFTSGAVSEIISNEQYLEINFKEERFVITDNYGKIEYRQLMIPLTGRFASPNNFALFYGTSSYNNTPMICNTGYRELRELLIALEI
jgi:hypothetical protein